MTVESETQMPALPIVSRPSSICWVAVLKSAPNLAEKAWVPTISDFVDLPCEKESGSDSMGTRIYHYRTRSLRAGLLGVTFFVFAFLPIAWLGRTYADAPKPDANIILQIILLCAGLVVGWSYYLRSSIRTDDNGITQTGPFGKRSIPWQDVQLFDRQTRGGIPRWVVYGTTTAIRIGSGISDLEELKVEIAERMPNRKEL